jgi:hypothetical protein
MPHVTDVEQEKNRRKATVTVMLHGRAADLSCFYSFCVRASLALRSFSGVSFAEDAFSCRTSLSPNLSVKPVIGASWSRLRKVSLPQFKLSSVEARLAPSASCVFSEVSAVAMDADAPRAQADNQQNRFLMDLRPVESRTSRILTQPRSPRGVGSHDLKNVAARHSVMCGPETNCCGTAVSPQI